MLEDVRERYRLLGIPCQQSDARRTSWQSCRVGGDSPARSGIHRELRELSKPCYKVDEGRSVPSSPTDPRGKTR